MITFKTVKNGIAGISCLVAVFFLTAPASAEEFVSLNGGFRIAYPPNWMQVDYRTADHYIQQTGARLAYEAVFMDRAAPSFFEGDYLILTVDTVGELTQQQIDSALAALAEDLGREIAEVTPDEFMADTSGAILTYDRENQAVATVSDVVVGQVRPKKNILVMKFYNKGVANFYFYSAEGDFARALPLYKQIFATFTTESRQRTGGPEEIKVYDPDARGVNTTLFVIIGGFLVAAVVIIIIIAQKKRAVR